MQAGPRMPIENWSRRADFYQYGDNDAEQKSWWKQQEGDEQIHRSLSDSVRHSVRW